MRPKYGTRIVTVPYMGQHSKHNQNNKTTIQQPPCSINYLFYVLTLLFDCVETTENPLRNGVGWAIVGLWCCVPYMGQKKERGC